MHIYEFHKIKLFVLNLRTCLSDFRYVDEYSCVELGPYLLILSTYLGVVVLTLLQRNNWITPTELIVW